MIDPKNVCLYIPPGLADFKLNLFERIAKKLVKLGGRFVRHSVPELEALPQEVLPAVGCTPELRPSILRWQAEGRPWMYWDRGYCRRVFASDLPWGTNGGYYRWHIGGFQLQQIREVPGDRWAACDQPLHPWRREGRHIVVAEPSPTYQRFHGIEGWTKEVTAELKKRTDRPLVFREKEMQRFGRKLHEDLAGAHCLVTHGSNAAVEAVIQGCPVFVHETSAARLVGLTDLDKIEEPIYPDREPWARALAYSQFNEAELVDGTLWRLIT